MWLSSSDGVPFYPFGSYYTRNFLGGFFSFSLRNHSGRSAPQGLAKLTVSSSSASSFTAWPGSDSTWKGHGTCSMVEKAWRTWEKCWVWTDILTELNNPRHRIEDKDFVRILSDIVTKDTKDTWPGRGPGATDIRGWSEMLSCHPSLRHLLVSAMEGPQALQSWWQFVVSWFVAVTICWKLKVT